MGRQKHKGCGNTPVVNDYWRASWSISKDRRHISLLVNSQQQHTSSAMYYNLYPNEYYVIHNGNSYSKHVYMDGERIATLVGSNNNLLDGYSGSNVDVAGVQFIQGNPDAYYASKCADKEDDLMNSLENDFGKTYYPSYLQNTVIYNGAQVTDLPYYYHHDHLGSTCLVTDSLGNVDQRIEYMPDGNIFFQTVNGSYSTPFRFNGQEFDDDTELYYYGARYYDRKLGIWTSPDPLELEYPGISSYAYCAGNPIKYIDQDGLRVIPVYHKKDETLYYKSKKEFRDAMILFGKTSFGHKLLSDFTPKGQTIFGVQGNGRFAQYNLYLHEYDLEGQAQGVFFFNNGNQVNAQTQLHSENGKPQFTIIFDVQRTQDELLETINHEFSLHLSNYMDIINAFEKNGQYSDAVFIWKKESGSMQHEDLQKGKKGKLQGTKNYYRTVDELIRINSKNR